MVYWPKYVFSGSKASLLQTGGINFIHCARQSSELCGHSPDFRPVDLNGFSAYKSFSHQLLSIGEYIFQVLFLTCLPHQQLLLFSLKSIIYQSPWNFHSVWIICTCFSGILEGCHMSNEGFTSTLKNRPLHIWLQKHQWILMAYLLWNAKKKSV